ncbi:lipopolysaccharide biosynthesis protein [Arcticibacter svalbardensis MN12-7]|uniref:Lipopolysaccharide biosynthesis protein n=1 Tax=Arcticibacter svalbardensis MN12-7 TaxID=1150600 RepID=R9GR38_9SPHI|nr:LPS biosynthesis protein [Arcticibacter svalbardensis]EOR94020.1 lipopolysaccharide biosynthesis protein [Arcticibacter svalbardensis MN12-7]
MKAENTNRETIASDEVSLKDLILKIRRAGRYLLSKWVTVFVFGVFGGILGFTYAWIKKPIYTATTTFVLEEDKSGSSALGSLAGLASIAGVDLGGGGGGIFQGDNILELYKSRTMIEKTLLTEIDFNGKKQLLVDWYIEFNKLRKVWDKKPGLKELQFSSLDDSNPNLKSSRLKDSILGVVVKDINKNYLTVAKPDKKLSIINVEVNAPDEVFAKAFNDQIVKNVNDFYVQTKTKKSISNIKILQHKTDSVLRVMNGAIYSGVAIADATPNLNITRQVQRMAPIQRSQFSAETNKAILSELVKNLEMSKMALMKETPLIQVLDQPIFPLEKTELGLLKGIVLGALLFGFLGAMFVFLKKIFSVV